MKRKRITRAVLSLILTVLMGASAATLPMVSASAETQYDIFVRGSFNGWSSDGAYRLRYEGNGRYSLCLALTGGNHEYKIATADWSTFVAPGGGNATLNLPGDSVVRFTADTNTRTQTAEIVSSKPTFTMSDTPIVMEAESCSYFLGGCNVLYDAAASSGAYIGDFSQGDSLHFVVSVAAAGYYRVTARVASAETGGNLTLSAGGASDNAVFAKTGGWQSYNTVTFVKYLASGVQNIAVVNDGGVFNIDSVNLSKYGSTGIPVSQTGTSLIYAKDYASLSNEVLFSQSANAVTGLQAGDKVSYFANVAQGGVYELTALTSSSSAVKDALVISGSDGSSRRVSVKSGRTSSDPVMISLGSSMQEITVRFEAPGVSLLSLSLKLSDNIQALGYGISDSGDAAKLIDGNTDTQWVSQKTVGAYAGVRFMNAVKVNSVELFDLASQSDNITAGRLCFSDGSSVSVGALDNTTGKSTVVSFTERETRYVVFEVVSVSGTTSAAGLAEMRIKGKKVDSSATDISVNGRVRTSDSWRRAEDAINGISRDKGGFDIAFDREVTLSKVVFCRVSDSLSSVTSCKLTLASGEVRTLSVTRNSAGDITVVLPSVYSYSFSFDFGTNPAFADIIQVYGDTAYKGSTKNISSEKDYRIFENGITEDDSRVIANTGDSITTSDSGSDRTWNLSRDLSGAAQFSAPNSPLAEAVYNLSMEEIYKSVNYDEKFGDVFYTGVNWQKVWTRDTAMSCQYSLAWLFPEISENCARAKVVGSADSNYTFEEDTGTGGSYPVSDDKIITLLSVWENYLATGDKDMLSYFYKVAENTINQDFAVCYDKEVNLFRGETCGLDHRDKTYPDWMSENARESLTKIAESKATNTNIIFCQAFEIMSKAATALGKGSAEVEKWAKLHDELEKTISARLFNNEMGLYASWEYPTYMGSPLSYKADVIANGYAAWFEIGTNTQINSVLKNYPLVSFGADTVYPQKNGQQSAKIYHNRGIWPGWEATLMIGANYRGNEQLSEEIWNSCIRGAATSLTNKEVIDFTTGAGIESDQQLWSIAGTLSGYLRVLFGMEYTEKGISFDPYIPQWMSGPFTLSNLNYRNSELTLMLSGEGDTIVSFMFDGQKVANDFMIPAGITGSHKIEIVMEDSGKRDEINLDDDANHVTCPDLPVLKYSNGVLSWTRKTGLSYKLWTGSEYIDVSGSSYTPDKTVYGCYSLVAVSADGIWSEMSSPISVNPTGELYTIEAESGSYGSGKLATSISGYSGSGYIQDNRSNSTPVSFTVNVSSDGIYQLSCVYSNVGNTNDSTDCGIRSVYVDGKDAGTLVFPKMNFPWQTSTHLGLSLTKGSHTITVKYDNADWYDRNMSATVNNVSYDYFRLEKTPEAKQMPVPTDPTPVYNVILGDADLSEAVNVKDATLIQKYTARLATLSEDAMLAANVNADSDINVKDATAIQKYCASIETGYDIGSKL